MITDTDIRKLLLEINKNKVDGQIITRPLSGEVTFAKVWQGNLFSFHRQPEKDITPLTCYFIREKGDEYLAAVLVADSLIWYILPQYRKSNTFIIPFRDVVIPHLLQHKPVQRLLINRAEYGAKEFTFIKKTALAAGFKIIRENESEIKMAIEAASLEKQEYISGRNTGISQKRIEEVKNEIALFVQKLKIFETEIELKTGDIGCLEDVREVTAALAGVSGRLEDFR